MSRLLLENDATEKAKKFFDEIQNISGIAPIFLRNIFYDNISLPRVRISAYWKY